MAQTLSYFISYLRQRPQRLTRSMLVNLIRELSLRLRHDDIVIEGPDALFELAYNLRRAMRITDLPLNQIGHRLEDLVFNLERISPELAFQFEQGFGMPVNRAHLKNDTKIDSIQEVSNNEKVNEKSFQQLEELKFKKTDKVLFLVGAGASKPEPSKIPTLKELLPELWKRSEQMENQPLSKLKAWCEESEIDNIEELLTALTISNYIIENNKIHALLNSVLYSTKFEIGLRDLDSIVHLQNMTESFFSLLVGTMLHAKPNNIHKAIVKYTKKHKNTQILTTNYDTCIDQALEDSNVKYNTVFNETVKPNSIPLIKMHGSINWFYCGTCQKIYLPSINSVESAIKQDIPYAITGMCSSCKGQIKQFIIPPVAHKYLTHPPIIQVWDYGRKAVDAANIFVIIGYSFSDADDYIAKMLVKAIGQDISKKVLVVNTNKESIERLKSFITQHVGSFDTKSNLLTFSGKGEDLISPVIDKLLVAES